MYQAALSLQQPLLQNFTADATNPDKGRIYVANEYPNFARTILIFCQEIRILHQNYLE